MRHLRAARAARDWSGPVDQRDRQRGEDRGRATATSRACRRGRTRIARRTAASSTRSRCWRSSAWPSRGAVWRARRPARRALRHRHVRGRRLQPARAARRASTSAVARDSFVHHWQKASFRLLGEDEYLRIYRENEARFRAKWALRMRHDPLGPLRLAASYAPATGDLRALGRLGHRARAAPAPPRPRAGAERLRGRVRQLERARRRRRAARDRAAALPLPGRAGRARGAAADDPVDVPLQLRLPRRVPAGRARGLRLDRRPRRLPVRPGQARRAARARAARVGPRDLGRAAPARGRAARAPRRALRAQRGRGGALRGRAGAQPRARRSRVRGDRRGGQADRRVLRGARELVRLRAPRRDGAPPARLVVRPDRPGLRRQPGQVRRDRARQRARARAAALPGAARATCIASRSRRSPSRSTTSPSPPRRSSSTSTSRRASR